MTQKTCPACGRDESVRPHCKRNCGVLKCVACDAIWTIDGHLVYQPAET